MMLFASGCEPPPENREQNPGLPDSPVLAENGMVVAAHPVAAEVGLEVLREGGNAFEAAIAVKYALAVVYPVAGNIGGGGFMVYRTQEGETGSLDFRETAPAAAFDDMYLDEETGEPVQQLSRLGHLAAGVPGTVDGMQKIYERYGQLPFDRLIQPAIDLAENGHELTGFNAMQLNRAQEDFRAANLYEMPLLRKDDWQAGDSLRFPDLAATLMRIRESGADGFYEGRTAELIVAEMQRGGGIITLEDLAGYEAIWRDAITLQYGDYQIHSMPPSSSGGVAIGQLLLGSAGYDFGELGHNTPESIHLMTELMRRVYADRATHLGDTDYYDVPLDMLLDPAYIRERNADISMESATPSTDIKEGEVDEIESFQTTHFSIVDAMGNAVSITTTVNSYFGSKVMVEGGGFFLNNEMNDFSIQPGVPNQFGLVGGEANAIGGGKRMLSSMSPTIVEKDDALFMVLGTPGGSTIITNVYQVIMNVIEHGLPLQQAVDAPKMHAQWLPDVITLEEGILDEDGREALEARGHELQEIPQIGRMQAIRVHQGDGDGAKTQLTGVADITRTGDSAARGF
jgi:gamma-glutamyltranspeptidase/glutathione hydrolase